MQATVQVLKQLFADSRRVTDANGLIEHAVAHLAELPGVNHVAILVHQTGAPHRVRARAARGMSLQLVEALGVHAPRGLGTVSADWPRLPEGVPPGLQYCAVPLAATPEQVTLLCDGTTEGETISLVATFLALALERDQAVTDALRLGELFNVGPVVVFRWRNAPGWPVEYVSPNVTRALGYSLEQLVEQAFAPLVHPGDLERVAAEVAEAIARDVPYFTQHYRMLDADAQVREVFDFTHVIRDSAGAVTHFHGYVFDDGDQARAERARELVGRLEQSQRLQAVGTLASGIAHDFNNVLAAILAHLELARLEPPLADNADLADAMQAAIRGRDIVRQLLVFGRNKEPERFPHRLQRLIEDSMGMMRSTIPSTIGLRFALDPKAPHVMADATQLQQVLVNLVTNAAHAMPRGGTVEISLATGAGSPPRAELTVKHESQGVTERGVGLSMMHTLVKAHGGTVEVTADRVVISFPGLARPAAGLEALPLDAVPGNQQRIVLVDDEPLVARATERLVSQFGYRVTAISTGQEVLKAFAVKSDAFELVLTDQTMPEMTGLELTHALRAGGFRVPVLLVTGLPMEIDVKSIEPPFAVLGKPYRAEELANALAELLERRAR